MKQRFPYLDQAPPAEASPPGEGPAPSAEFGPETGKDPGPRESIEVYRTLVENVDLGITLIGPDHRIRMTNRRVGQWFGRPAEAFEGRLCYAEFEKRGEVCAHCPGVRALASGRPEELETEGVRDDGSRISVRVQAFPLFGEDGTASGFIEVIEETTARRRAEAELRLAAAAFESQEAITVTDRAGTIVRVNAAFTRITGYSPEEVLGKNPRILQSGRHDADFYRAMWDAIAANGHWRGEIWNRRKDGEIYPELLSITAVRDPRGEITHYAGTFSDITEFKRQQARIERTAAEEQALGALLRCALEPLEMRAFLQRALDTLLTSIPWLSFLPKGGVFLTDREGLGEGLELVACRGLSQEIRTACARVPFGTCLCGRAAASRELVFAGCVDDRHEIAYDGMAPHGHYSIPIPAPEGVYGVTVLYLAHGHRRDAHEEAFLRRVADVLSMGIARRHAEARMDQLAYRDGLTGLPNRRLLLNLLDQAIGEATRSQRPGALLYIDLDGFKLLNDSLGHGAGDDLIVQFGRGLGAQARAGDTMARLGGDEFAVLLRDLGTASDAAGREARSVAEQLREVLCRSYRLGEHHHDLTVSIGIAQFPADGATAEECLRHAEIAMHRARADSRNALRFFQPAMQTAAEGQFRLEKGLRRALEGGELRLHFQPQVDGTGRAAGAEALLRWEKPGLGLVSPGDFIPVAEETGLILPIGEWVLREACARLGAWRLAGPGHALPHLSVNVSPKQFYQRDFVHRVEDILADTGIDPAWLVLELTEGVVIRDVEATIRKMQALQGLGIGFSLDDFGIGYSSLAYLKRLPLQVLKIDQSFIQNVCTDTGDAAIVETVIAMARHLGLTAVAEGVETEAQVRFLVEKGCQRFQGYYFSRPLPEPAFVAFLERYRDRAGKVPVGTADPTSSVGATYP